MNKYLYQAAFFMGLIAVCWVGIGYIGSNPLALTMTALIGAFYLMGALELRRFHQATSTLEQALTALPERLPSLGGWLDKVHASLRNPVRLRIEGARTGLPGPAMTPYLAGFLVLLGMLGTFLGMAVTLNGTAVALDGTTDLQTIRASLAAPVKGLGLAFGTSIAGVSASAMLGLMSALCRRERLQAAQALDTGIATTLRVFTPAHQRQESLETLQLQTRLMPELVDRLQAMMAQMERQSQQLNERLLAGQESFQRNAEAAYSTLAASVDRSLRESLTEGARIAGATIQPVVEATMSGIAKETTALHDGIASTVQLQLDTMAARFGATVGTVAEGLATTVSGMARETTALHGRMAETVTAQLDGVSTNFEQRSAALMQTVDKSHADLQAQLESRDEQRLAAWSRSLESMAVSLQREWQQAGRQSLEQQERICGTLEETARNITAQAQAHAGNTIAEIARLMQAASEAPRAAAEVIAELRRKLSDSMAQDNALLEERSRIMQALATLLDAVNQASTEQRAAIDSLVETSAALLDRVGTRFTETVGTESEKLTASAAQITGSAVEVASLGEAFGFGVQLFSESNDKLIANLHRIEGSLNKSVARSDEQLAYYVAQAREIIDLSIMSQKQIVEDLQQLSSRQSLLAAEAG